MLVAQLLQLGKGVGSTLTERWPHEKVIIPSSSPAFPSHWLLVDDSSNVDDAYQSHFFTGNFPLHVISGLAVHQGPPLNPLNETPNL